MRCLCHTFQNLTMNHLHLQEPQSSHITLCICRVGLWATPFPRISMLYNMLHLPAYALLVWQLTPCCVSCHLTAIVTQWLEPGDFAATVIFCGAVVLWLAGSNLNVIFTILTR